MKKYLQVLGFSLFVIVCLSNSVDGQHEAKELQSPRVTTWGSWGSWERCPGHGVVTALRCKVEGFQGHGRKRWRDDTALNAISLGCNDLSETSRDLTWITSSEGSWGTWRNVDGCPWGTYAFGFSLRSEKYQGMSDMMDDTAANDIQLYCRHPGKPNQSSVTLHGGGETWGDWTAPQFCPQHHGICGLRTQVEGRSWIRDKDDTSLNNVDMVCCRTSRT